MWKKYKFYIIAAVVLVGGYFLYKEYKKKNPSTKSAGSTATTDSTSVLSNPKTDSQKLAINKALFYN